MSTLFDAAQRRALLDRFDRLSPDRRPQWGKLSCTQMIGHCADPMRAAMGEMEVKSKGPSLLSNRLVRRAVIYWFPFPKGAPTAPEFIPPAGGDWKTAIDSLRSTVDRFVAHAAKGGTFRPHPAFGDISTADWGCLTAKHLEHHLRQFGG